MQNDNFETLSLDRCVGKNVKYLRTTGICKNVERVVEHLEVVDPKMSSLETVRQLNINVQEFISKKAAEYQKQHVRVGGVLDRASFLKAIANDSEYKDLLATCESVLRKTHNVATVETEEFGDDDNVNVLNFDGDFGNSGDWLTVGEGEFPRGSSPSQGQVDGLLQSFYAALERDDTSEAAAASVNSDTLISPDSSGRLSSSENYYDDFAKAVLGLLEVQPDRVLQAKQWRQISRLLCSCAHYAPITGEPALTKYFSLSGSRQRLCLLEEVLDRVEHHTELLFLPILYKLMLTFHNNSILINDDDLLPVFQRLLTCCLTYIDFFSQEDPCAKCMTGWFARSSLIVKITATTSFIVLMEGITSKLSVGFATALDCLLLRTLIHTDRGLAVHHVGALFNFFIEQKMELNESIVFTAETLAYCLSYYEEEQAEEIKDVFAKSLDSLHRVDTKTTKKKDESFVTGLLKMVDALVRKRAKSIQTDEIQKMKALWTTLNAFQNESIAVQAQVFWSTVLPMFVTELSDLVETIITAVCAPSPHMSYAYVVCISSSVDGWCMLYDRIEGKEKLLLNYASVLKGILTYPHGKGMQSTTVITPATFQLLTRWCTSRLSRTELLKVIDSALSDLLTRSNVKDRLVDSAWPLLVPIEFCDDVICNPASAEKGRGVSKDLDKLLLYQMLKCTVWSYDAPLLEQLPLPDLLPAPQMKSYSARVDCVLDQLFGLWVEREEVEGNRAPFDEDSLVFVLNILTMCVLINPYAECALWRCPFWADRLQALRLFCQSRRGVDPVYFSLRFLTSAKGKKRLSEVLLNEFLADSRVDVVIDVDSFAEGESRPPLLEEVTSLDEKVEPTIAEAFPQRPAQDRALREVVAFAILAFQGSTIESVSDLIRQRTEEEWKQFNHRTERSFSVCRLLEANPSVHAILVSCGVDPFFLCTLCIGNWLRSLINPKGSGNICRQSIREFLRGGIEGWDRLISKSLCTFVEKAHEEQKKNNAEDYRQDLWICPVTSRSVSPSPLLVALLVKPFVLVTEGKS